MRRPPALLIPWLALVCATACAKLPGEWCDDLAARDPFQRELAVAALGRFPPHLANDAARRLVAQLSDCDNAVATRAFAALDRQIEPGWRGFLAGRAALLGADPWVERELEQRARAHAPFLLARLAEFLETTAAAPRGPAWVLSVTGADGARAATELIDRVPAAGAEYAERLAEVLAATDAEALEVEAVIAALRDDGRPAVRALEPRVQALRARGGAASTPAR